VDIRYIACAGYDLIGCTVSGTSSDNCFDKGTIELEPGWSLVAIPIQYGYWDNILHKHIHDGATIAKIKNYIIDQVDDVYGQGLISVANTYIGDTQAYYSYVPGVTPETSPHNFQLIYLDGVNKEISGFWINYTGNTPITLVWGE